MVIGLVLPFTISKAVLKPDILHVYILKLAGHCTLALSIVNLSFVLLGEFIDPVAKARFGNVLSFHWNGGVSPVTTDTTVSNKVLEFFSSCLKNTERSCERLVMDKQKSNHCCGESLFVRGLVPYWSVQLLKMEIKNH